MFSYIHKCYIFTQAKSIDINHILKLYVNNTEIQSTQASFSVSKLFNLTLQMIYIAGEFIVLLRYVQLHV